jgi:hypothetical protein
MKKSPRSPVHFSYKIGGVRLGWKMTRNHFSSTLKLAFGFFAVTASIVIFWILTSIY